MQTTDHTHYRSMSAWTVGNQVEATVPAALRDDLALAGGQQVALVPDNHDGRLQIHASLDPDGDRSNHRTLKGRSDSSQITLRHPSVLSAATGLLSHVETHDDAKLAYSRPSDTTRQFTITPTPTLSVPELDTTPAESAVEPAEKALLEQQYGYAIDLDNRFVRELDLSRDSLVTWTLARRDGRLMLAADCDPAADPDAPNVRPVHVHQSGVADALADQFRLFLPAVLVAALYWETVPLRFEVHSGRLVVAPAVEASEIASKRPV